jgi:hypothetical protein
MYILQLGNGQTDIQTRPEFVYDSPSALANVAKPADLTKNIPWALILGIIVVWWLANES